MSNGTQTSGEPSRLHRSAGQICAAVIDRDAVIASPRDAEEISALLRYCDSEKLPVCPSGSRTKTSWLSPANPSLELNTARVNAVLEHPWQDMTCTVQAGCTWSGMQAALAQYGQFVALDPLWPERATVGGVVAANDSGALRVHYGGLRDLVIGMQVVLADGTIARSGGKVVKNVAGYDLGKLFCGSFGTLGVITEVTFRLHSLPSHAETVSVKSDSVEALASVLGRILGSHTTFVAMQIRANSMGAALDVKLAVSPAVAAKQREAILDQASLAGAMLIASDSDVWSARQKIYDAGGDGIVFKMSMLPAHLGHTLATIVALGGTAVAQANGLISACLPAVEGLIELRSNVESSGGSLVLHRLPSGIEIDRWGKPPDGLALMHAVKRHFDPNAILNPGRFVGGI